MIGKNALRHFKRKVQTEDIIKDVKLHSYKGTDSLHPIVATALGEKRE
jgi:hypothetical protein